MLIKKSFFMPFTLKANIRLETLNATELNKKRGIILNGYPYYNKTALSHKPIYMYSKQKIMQQF